MSNVETKWQSLREKLAADIEKSRNIAGGTQNYYRLQGLKEVLEWMDDLHVSTPVRTARTVELPARILVGRGDYDQGTYEVARYPRSKEYRVEYDDGKREKITLADAVKLSTRPELGQEGGSAFDKAWNAHWEPVNA